MITPVEDSRSRVNPQLLPLLDALPQLRIDGESLAATRRIFAELAARGLSEPAGQGVVRSEHHVPGNSPVRVIVYSPLDAADASPVVLHLHSGGYVLGVPEGRDAANRHWAATLGAVVVSVDYRLAPEAPYPAALEDAYSVLGWIMSSAPPFTVDPGSILVMGESAGGGLAAGLALLARDRAEYSFAGQILTYAMLDDRTGPDTPGPQGAYVWTRQDNEFAWRSLVGGAPAPVYAAPARAIDLEDLPPAALFIGDLDLFLAENLAYAGRLAEAGIPVDMHVYPGAFHAFDAVATADVARQFRVDVVRAARWMLAR